MKNKLFFLFISSLISLNNANAMEKEDIDHFQKTPVVLIVEIASYLYEDNFINFSLANKRINKSLKNHKNFFMPEEKEDVTKIIQETQIEKFSELAIKWKRTPKKKSIPLLRNLLSSFEEKNFNKENYKLSILNNNYNCYVIILNLLHVFSDNVEKKFREFYEDTEREYENTMNRVSPNQILIVNAELYKIYHTILGLLNPYYREEISKAYEKGEFPYVKDSQKSKKYSVLLKFPLKI